MGAIDVWCNGFTLEHKARWETVIEAQGLALRIRKGDDDSFVEPEGMVARLDAIGFSTLLLPACEVPEHALPIPAEQLPLIEQQVLDRLIQIELLLARATDADKAAAKESADRRLDEIKSRAKSEDVLNRQLKSMGTSQEEVRAKMTEEVTAENVLERELKITVSDTEVKQFYDTTPPNSSSLKWCGPAISCLGSKTLVRARIFRRTRRPPNTSKRKTC